MPSGELANTERRTRRSSPRGAKLRPKGPYRLGTSLQLEFITPDGRRPPRVERGLARDADGMPFCFSAPSERP